MVYQIICEQKTTEKDYAPLYRFIENELGKESLHMMRNVWWVYTDEELVLSQICDKFREYIGPSDLITVSRLDLNSYDGWLPGLTWEWLKAHNN